MFEQEIQRKVEETAKTAGIKVEVPPDRKLGDYAVPCFKLAKELSKNPKEVAEMLAPAMQGLPFVETAEPAGAYLNIKIKTSHLARQVLPSAINEAEGFSGLPRLGKKAVVEYSAPNTNKPQHLGHLRNNALGMAVSNILSFLGYDVVRVNWINDRGIHICKSMLAYLKWGKGKQPDKKPDHFVGDFYVLYSKNEDEKLKEEAQELLRRWEANDREVRALWRKMNSWAYEGFKETYKRFGCEFDKWYFESEIYKNAEKIIERGLKKGVFVRNSDGAIVAKLSDSGLPDKTIIRADGTSIYVTADLALGLEKAKEKFDISIYVVGSEQKLYLKQLFTIFRLLGYEWAERLVHLSYGMVFLPEGKMKSREGKVVDADDLMDEMSELAKREITMRHRELKEPLLLRRAEAIGIGALKFYLLKVDPEKDIYYNPEESISFEGETGPYLQYTHARMSSILRNAKIKSFPGEYSLLDEPEEKELLWILSEFPSAARQAGDTLKPHILAHYLLRLAQEFNEYYHKHHVLSAEKGLREQRLALVAASRKVLARGLSLLGIEPLDEM